MVSDPMWAKGSHTYSPAINTFETRTDPRVDIFDALEFLAVDSTGTPLIRGRRFLVFLAFEERLPFPFGTERGAVHQRAHGGIGITVGKQRQMLFGAAEFAGETEQLE
ncbi:MAG: hypothetical protein WDO73_00630 [Ignavibacteriota bacterium]